jgi:hypothetical protein
VKLRPLHVTRLLLRRRARLSVRVLMIIILLIGGGLGWLFHSARVQREAVEAIKRAGGWVLYEWEEPPRNSPWPKWLYDALGQDFLDRAIEASFDGVEHELDDSVLDQFGRLSHLETLWIGNCKSMTDARMVHLYKFTQLRTLILSDCSIQGEGLRHLAKLTHLESLERGIVKFRGWKKSGGVGLLETVHKDGSSDHLLNPTRSVQRPPLF